MKNKKIIIIVFIALTVALLGTQYKGIRSDDIKEKVYKHLIASGAKSDEIKEVIIDRSFINLILSYDEWIISVEYYDEPNVKYMYTYKDEIIDFTGISGGDIYKEKLEYKHLEGVGY